MEDDVVVKPTDAKVATPTEDKKDDDLLTKVAQDFIDKGEVPDPTKDDETADDKSLEKKEEKEEKKEGEKEEDLTKDLYPSKEEILKTLEEENTKELKFNIDEVDDSKIADVAYRADTYDALIKAAQEAERPMEDRFVAQIARSGIDPNFFAENKIFSMKDFVEQFKGNQELIDPDKVIYPHKGTPEQVAAFQEKWDNIPSEEEGYAEDVFADTAFANDEEAKRNMRSYFHDARLSREQARMQVERDHLERTFVEEATLKEMKAYAEGERETIGKTFQGDASNQMKNIGKLLWKYGEEFSGEFGNTKVLKSASFFNFMSRIIDAGDSSSRTTMNDFRKIVESGNTIDRSESWFNSMIERTLKHPNYTDKMKRSKEPSDRKKFNEMYRIHKVLNQAAKNRGFTVKV